MNLIKNFFNVTTFIEDDVLKGHTLDRMAIIGPGTEEITGGNVSSYDPGAGRVNFTSTLGGIHVKVIIID